VGADLVWEGVHDVSEEDPRLLLSISPYSLDPSAWGGWTDLGPETTCLDLASRLEYACRPSTRNMQHYSGIIFVFPIPTRAAALVHALHVRPVTP